MMGQLGVALPQGVESALHGRFIKPTGLAQPLPQPDDARKPVNYTIATLMGAHDEKTAIIGAKIQRRIKRRPAFCASRTLPAVCPPLRLWATCRPTLYPRVFRLHIGRGAIPTLVLRHTIWRGRSSGPIFIGHVTSLGSPVVIPPISRLPDGNLRPGKRYSSLKVRLVQLEELGNVWDGIPLGTSRRAEMAVQTSLDRGLKCAT